MLEKIWAYVRMAMLESALGCISGRQVAYFTFLLVLLVVCLTLLASDAIRSHLTPPVSERVAQRIGSLEESIKGLEDAHDLLSTMKADLEKADAARQQAEKDFQQSQELSKLSDEQIEAVGFVLRKRSWPDMAISFVLGVVTSLIAAFIYSKGGRMRKMSARRKRLARVAERSPEVAS